MHTYISMLRGINVSGQKMIKMTELKALYESLRLKNMATYIQSGNVVFQSKDNDPVLIGTSIEKAIEKSFGFPVTVVLRQPADFRKVISKCPFLGTTRTDESKLYVTFLKSRPALALVKAMALVADKSTDTYQISGIEIYLHCLNGYGKTTFSNVFFEKHLKVAATTRNWKTVQTLLAMSSASGRNDI
ncbi:MAG: DUF1697 domain-containing protein [Ignavibacteriales bacterium]|nr:DUF1697 domain-containing protein [Ignavibacteriales bacterium]